MAYFNHFLSSRPVIPNKSTQTQIIVKNLMNLNLKSKFIKFSTQSTASKNIVLLLLPYSEVITRSNFEDTVLNQLLYAHNGWKLSWVVHLMQKWWDSFLWPQAVRFQIQKMGNLTLNYISETENKDETILFILYIIQP